MAIGRAGAVNAALLAVAILGGTDAELRTKLDDYRRRQTERVFGRDVADSRGSATDGRR